jgi:predicted nucleic-acid-binding Zn-ribbon protein
MTDELRDQIYNSMNLKETEELIDIWRTNDQYAWSETAFEVVRQILTKRLSGKLPPQNKPILEAHEEDFIDEAEEIAVEETTDKDEMVCPSCKKTKLAINKLTVNGEGQKVLIDGNMVGFEDMLEVTCRDCGFTFIILSEYIQ